MKLRFAIIALIGLLGSSPVTARFFAGDTDDFNRGDSGTLGGEWTDQVAGLQVASTTAIGTGSGTYEFSKFNATSFTADHEAWVTLVNYDQGGVTVRADGTAGSSRGYWLLANSGGSNSYIFRYDSDVSFTLLTTLGVTFNNGDKAKLRVVGTTLTAYRDTGGGYSSIGTADTGGTYNDGQPGIQAFASTTVMDDWGADDVGGGGGAAPKTLMLLGAGGLQALLRSPDRQDPPAPRVGQCNSAVLHERDRAAKVRCTRCGSGRSGAA